MSALSDTVKWTVSASLIIFNYCILCPIVCYYLFRFIQKKDDIIIFKRYPKIVICINILIVVFLLLHRPCHILLTASPLRKYKPVYLGTMLNILLFALYAVPWLYLARFWLMFYDLKHGNSILNSRWQLYLDPGLIDDDFWTKHYNTLGSDKFVTKISLVLWFLTGLLWAVPYQISLNTDYFENGPTFTMAMMTITLFYFICCVCCSLIWCKTPQILDIFYLRYELKILIIMFWAVIILWTTVMIAQFIVNKHTDNGIVLYSMLIVQIISGSMNQLFLASASTIVILDQLKNENNHRSLQIQHDDDVMNLYDVILHKEYFELFVQHLCREFSMELMLCFVELLQFKEQLNKIYHFERLGTINNVLTIHEIDDGSVELEPDYTKIKLNYHNGLDIDFNKMRLSENPNIPQSHLIFSQINDENAENLRTYLKIAYLLFAKYIDNENDSHLTINISGEMRDCLKNTMSDMDSFVENNIDTMEHIELYEYFDVVIEELYQMLKYSFERFMQANIEINVARLTFRKEDTAELENILRKD